MNLAWISLTALTIAVVGGIALRINVGLLAFALAYAAMASPPYVLRMRTNSLATRSSASWS